MSENKEPVLSRFVCGPQLFEPKKGSKNAKSNHQNSKRKARPNEPQEDCRSLAPALSLSTLTIVRPSSSKREFVSPTEALRLINIRNALIRYGIDVPTGVTAKQLQTFVVLMQCDQKKAAALHVYGIAKDSASSLELCNKNNNFMQFNLRLISRVSKKLENFGLSELVTKAWENLVFTNTKYFSALNVTNFLLTWALHEVASANYNICAAVKYTEQATYYLNLARDLGYQAKEWSRLMWPDFRATD